MIRQDQRLRETWQLAIEDFFGASRRFVRGWDAHTENECEQVMCETAIEERRRLDRTSGHPRSELADLAKHVGERASEQELDIRYRLLRCQRDRRRSPYGCEGHGRGTKRGWHPARGDACKGHPRSREASREIRVGHRGYQCIPERMWMSPVANGIGVGADHHHRFGGQIERASPPACFSRHLDSRIRRTDAGCYKGSRFTVRQTDARHARCAIAREAPPHDDARRTEHGRRTVDGSESEVCRWTIDHDTLELVAEAQQLGSGVRRRTTETSNRDELLRAHGDLDQAPLLRTPSTRPAREYAHPLRELLDGDSSIAISDRIDKCRDSLCETRPHLLILDQRKPRCVRVRPEPRIACRERAECAQKSPGQTSWNRTGIETQQRVQVRARHRAERGLDAQPHDRGGCRRRDICPNRGETMAHERRVQKRVGPDDHEAVQSVGGGDRRSNLIGGSEWSVRTDKLQGTVAHRRERRVARRTEITAGIRDGEGNMLDLYAVPRETREGLLPER
jgi:hypothetical protein